MMTDDDKMRRYAKQMLEVSRGLKRTLEHPAFEPVRKWQQMMREAELELAAEGETEAPASETATPTPQSDARQASDTVIRNEIGDVYDEAAAKGEKAPNVLELADQVQPRLKARGFHASKSRIREIGEEFAHRRGPVGPHFRK
jgi:hypothetical protein